MIQQAIQKNKRAQKEKRKREEERERQLELEKAMEREQQKEKEEEQDQGKKREKKEEHHRECDQKRIPKVSHRLQDTRSVLLNAKTSVSPVEKSTTKMTSVKITNTGGRGTRSVRYDQDERRDRQESSSSTSRRKIVDSRKLDMSDQNVSKKPRILENENSKENLKGKEKEKTDSTIKSPINEPKPLTLDLPIHPTHPDLKHLEKTLENYINQPSFLQVQLIEQYSRYHDQYNYYLDLNTNQEVQFKILSGMNRHAMHGHGASSSPFLGDLQQYKEHIDQIETLKKQINTTRQWVDYFKNATMKIYSILLGKKEVTEKELDNENRGPGGVVERGADVEAETIKRIKEETERKQKMIEEDKIREREREKEKEKEKETERNKIKEDKDQKHEAEKQPEPQPKKSQLQIQYEQKKQAIKEAKIKKEQEEREREKRKREELSMSMFQGSSRNMMM